MVPAGSRRLVGIRLAAAKRAGPGARGALHLVQRDPATRAVVGGVALTVAVRAR